MIRSKKSFVVAIAGTSGAGKSTLCHNLLSMIADSTLFELDKYEEVAGIWPHMTVWRASNFDPNMANLTQPAYDLQQVIAGQSIEYPSGQGSVHPAGVIIFDVPIGRTHTVLAPLIDFVVFVDLPYEVALARRVNRIIDLADSDNAAVNRLRSFIPFYLESGRLMYRYHNELVQASTDVTIDGMQAPDILANDVFKLIQKHRS